MNLSDVWVVVIIKSPNMSREERSIAWPSVFSVKGTLRSGFVHKGQAVKLFDSESNNFRYALLDGVHNMFEAEGVSYGLPSRRPDKLKNVGVVEYDLVAQIQNVKYEVDNSPTPEGRKKSNASQRTTRRTRQFKKSETDDKN